jgi:hypothetical protein
MARPISSSFICPPLRLSAGWSQTLESPTRSSVLKASSVIFVSSFIHDRFTNDLRNPSPGLPLAATTVFSRTLSFQKRFGI